MKGDALRFEAWSLKNLPDDVRANQFAMWAAEEAWNAALCSASEALCNAGIGQYEIHKILKELEE